MTDLRPVVSLLLSFTMSVGAFVALSRLEDTAVAARLRETMGFTRGDFLDRSGRPLVYTADAHGRARRVFALPSLAPVVGYQDPSGRWHGLEARYNGLLDGRGARQDWRTFLLHLTGRSVQGDRVRLTIDPTIQSAADAALGHARGAVAAIDPRTGGVLALVSKPYCTADAVASRRSYARCVRSPQQPLRDRALQLVVPPGSSFKIVTLSAALDTHHFGLDTVFSGADVVGPSPYFDNTAYPSNLGGSGLTQLTLAQALAQSDNFTFAHIGLSLGARTLLRYAHRYLIGRQIPFDLPVARSSVADGKLRPTTPELAQSAFGATVDRVTTMQMALIAATVANGGVMMAPHLVQDVEDPSGHVLRRYHDHPLSRVVSRGADQQVTRGMVYVVAHGSGYLAQIPGVEVAGKTGTADSGASKPHAWFVAFAPARHPVVAVAVLNEYSGEGFQYAAPIARKVLMAALRESGHRV